mgnify:FL=1
MKKGFSLLLMLFTVLNINAQKKNQPKDTVKTEVVNVVTKYNPKIADAKKIKINPKIKLLKQNEKKQLKYTIFSAPVASTFKPKSGVVKGIDVGVKERIYKNYLALGFGNYTTPFFETFLHHNTRFKNEFGFNSKYLSSLENVKNSVLKSNFTNFNIGAYYKQNDRYFDWKVALNSERNQYNWYGLPDLIFTEPTTNAINPEQVYNYFELLGEFNFKDSYIDYGKIKTSYYTDSYKSSEILGKFSSKLDFPLAFLNPSFNNISITNSVEFLKGNFKNNYKGSNSLDYATVTVNIHPYYKINEEKLQVKFGANFIASFDPENSSTNVLVMPDLYVQAAIYKQYLHFYGGYNGDLKTNTFKNLTEENPYLSPTLFITQTLEKYNGFVGLRGNITNDISYNIKGSMKFEEDKPLFVRNASKSNGTNNAVNGNTLKGYEYGNSFNLFYDDIKTNAIYLELEYDFSRYLSFKTQGVYKNYDLEYGLNAWNLPTIEASFSAKYNNNKWYTSADIFYVDERKDVLYNAQFPSSLKGIDTLNSFVDVNLNGGYHFNDKFSAFLKLNNVLNTDYQRFANFNTQGFQVLGGFTYKFDF